MTTHAFPLASPLETSPEQTASQLLSRFKDPDEELAVRLEAAYGSDGEIHRERAAAAVRTLEHYLESYGDGPCRLYRAPARLSLNPHSDHQGAWVPYGLHVRELLCALSLSDDDRVEITNVDPTFESRLTFAVSDEKARDPHLWSTDWFRYIEAEPVVQTVRDHLDVKGQKSGRRATANYVRAAVLRMHHAYPEAEFPGLRMTFNGNIAQGSGQSSSSALAVTAALALGQAAGLELDRRVLAERCGEAEWYVGTRGGSGDHAAILLGSRAGLTHLCFQAPFGVRGVKHSTFPSGYELIVANSQTQSQKSAEERLLFNTGIFAYRFGFLALKEAMAEIGIDAETIAQTRCLGDLHTGRFSNATLYRLVRTLPEYVSSEELAARFPQTFAGAARGCFGTEELNRLPMRIPLRGAAVYGLGRVDRGRMMPEILDDASDEAMCEFGRLMTITHDGDRLTHRCENYHESRQRLADEAIEAAHAAECCGESRPLREEPGFYGASIRELDHLVDVANELEGVLGAGLMGAGGGGYVLILARAGLLPALKAHLKQGYYDVIGKQPDVEAWRPTAAAGRLA